MQRFLSAVLLCLCLCACSGSRTDAPGLGGDAAVPLDAWRTAQLAELDSMPLPAGVAPELWQLLKGRFREFILSAPQKSALAAPANPASAPKLSLDDETLTLSWRHSMTGDYSQDSEVGINDLTPLGQHFNSSSELGGAFDYETVQSVVDGDGNGQINISDISPIGASFGRRCSSYNVYASLSFDDLPDSPDGENGPGAELVASVDFADAAGAPGQERLAFSLVLEEARPGWFYWVRPADGASEGTPSNAVSFGGGDDNVNPEAVLSAAPLAGEAPLLVEFDAAGSFDFDGENQDISDIVQFNWDFDGDGSFDIASFAPTISHSFNTPGEFNARVQVVDAQAGVGEDTVLVTVAQPGNLPPVASFTADPLSGTAPLNVAFDDSATSDDGGIENLLYEWDFNGDGFFDLSTDSTAVVENFYQGGGDFLVELRVTDLGGLSDSHQVALNVEGDPINTPPVAVLTPSVTEGAIPLEVSFDFSASADPDGEIVLYQLDLDGNGDFEVSLETEPVVIEHTYETGGLFNARLRVEDNLGAFDTEAVQILASDGNNLPPSASFSFDPPGGIVPLEVTFDASASDDDDGSIVLYEWDFEGEGDFSFQTDQPITQHTYTTGGTRLPGLRVTDNDGGTAELTNVFLLTIQNPNNDPPVAQLAVTELSGTFPQEYEFDGSGSSDSDGEIEEYIWDFDGDTFTDRVTSEPVTTYKYFAIGSYTPRLIVKDNEDETGETAGDEIEVSSGWQGVEVDSLGQFPGVLSLTFVKTKDGTDFFIAYVHNQGGVIRVARANVDSPLDWTVLHDVPTGDDVVGTQVSVMSVEQAPAIFYLDMTTLQFPRLRYIRAADFEVSSWNPAETVKDSGDINSNTALVSRLFAGAPSVIVDDIELGLTFLRADDNLGSSWDGTGVIIDPAVKVIQNPGIGPVSAAAQLDRNVLYYKAGVNDGSSWSGASLAAENASTANGSGQLGMGLAGGLPAIAYVDNIGSLMFVRAEDSAGSSWSAPVTVYQATESPDITRGHITFGTRNGHPALVCEYGVAIMCVEALDANGASWGEAELAALEGSFPNKPAAFIGNSGILIAYRTRINDSEKLMVAFRE